MNLYITHTMLMARSWWADDFAHAEEQHLDMFRGQSGEEILRIEIVQPIITEDS